MYAPKSAAKAFGPLAQLGERLHGMEEVESSSLLRSTKSITTEPSTNWGSLVEMRQAEACLLFYWPLIRLGEAQFLARVLECPSYGKR